MIQKPTIFTAYEFTHEEIRSALIGMSDVAIALLQTRVAELAAEKVALTIDAALPTQFIQQEAHLTGGIDELSQFLEQVRLAKQEFIKGAKAEVVETHQSHFVSPFTGV